MALVKETSAKPSKSKRLKDQRVPASILEQTLESPDLKAKIDESIAIDEMPLETIRDYRLYNERARKENKKLRICRYPIKPCPVELHPKQRVIFRRNDQPTNALPVFLSNALIHYDEMLYPGETYDLPECIVAYLSDKANPVWGWVDLADGSRETRIVNKLPRFSLTPVYGEY